MKLKKILAAALTATLVMTAVPNIGFTAYAEVNTADETAETETVPAPYGYKNLSLTIGTDVTITTSNTNSEGTTEVTQDGSTNVLGNADNIFLLVDNSGDKWINFHFTNPQKVSGLLYKQVKQTNGHVKIAKVEVKKQGSETYETVYQTASTAAWANDATVDEALFGTVSDVVDVRFYAVETYGTVTTRLHTQKMRILTTEEDTAVTAAVNTTDEKAGTASLHITDSTVENTSIEVSKGVSVTYQEEPTVEGVFVGWRNKAGEIVSKDAVYTTTVSDDAALTAVFEHRYKEVSPEILAANAKDNSHADGSKKNGVAYDGAAANAFDTGDESDATMWHENYRDTSAVTSSGSEERPSASNPIWIQTSFGTDAEGHNNVHKIGKLTYRGRPDTYTTNANTHKLLSTRIYKYVLLAANVQTGSPTEKDWAVVKSGIMPTAESDTDTTKTISELTFDPVEATHIRLVCISTYANDNFVCAGKIRIFEMNDADAVASEWESLPEMQTPEHGKVVITPEDILSTDDRNTDETKDSNGNYKNNSLGESASHVGKRLSGSIKDVNLTAIPDEGYLFAGWKNIEKNKIVSYDTTYLARETEVSNYVPVFTDASYSEIKVLEDNYSGTGNPDNIRTNSEMSPASNNDGPAWYAFDKSNGSANTTTLWHENYRNNAAAALGTTVGNNSVWVEVKLSGSQKVKRVTVTPRSGSSYVSRPKDYKILVANTTATTPADSDFVVVASGTFADNTNEKTVDLPVAVQPSHIRIAICSLYKYSNDYMAIANIGLYENTADTGTGAKVVAVTAPTVNDTAMGSVTVSKDKLVEGISTEVTLTATPNTGYHFVKWLVNDQSGKGVSEIADATTTVTMNGLDDASYQAVFAKDAEVSVSLDQTYLEMTLKNNGETVSQTLTATVENAGENNSVTWESSNSQIASVDNGVVTAKGEGEATITATPDADTTKSATCTVVVHAAPSLDTLNALLAQADTAVEADTTYSAESRTALQTIRDNIRNNMPEEAAAITAAEKELRDALEGLVEIYKISIPNDANLELTSDAAENEGNDSDTKWIYTPLFAKVALNVKNTTTASGEFAGWVYNNKTVCTSASYKFYVVGEMTFSVTYTEAVKKEVNLFCTSKYNTSAGKLSFIGKRSVPKDYTVVEHGIVITDATGWAKYESNLSAFVKGAARTKKSVAKGKANNGTYEAKMKCGKNEKWYGRSYVTYSDGHTTYTIYSEVESYPHN